MQVVTSHKPRFALLQGEIPGQKKHTEKVRIPRNVFKRQRGMRPKCHFSRPLAPKQTNKQWSVECELLPVINIIAKRRGKAPESEAHGAPKAKRPMG